jgi:hypothetical protein
MNTARLRPRGQPRILDFKQDADGSLVMKTSDTKLILGIETEAEIREWIGVLRATVPEYQAPGADPTCCGWLLMRNDGRLSWWKKRWFELQGEGEGVTLVYWDSSKEQRMGSWSLQNFQLFCPVRAPPQPMRVGARRPAPASGWAGLRGARADAAG